MYIQSNYISNERAVTGRKRTRRVSRHGVLVLEMLIALFISLLTGAALLVLTQLTMTERATTMGPANSDAEANLQLTKVSDSIRAAQSYGSGSNEVCFTAATASDITCYSDSTGNTLRTWLDTSVSPAVLKQTQTTSGVSTTSVLLSGVTALQFTYYKQASSTYNAPLSGWVTTTSPTAPTSAELLQLGAAKLR